MDTGKKIGFVVGAVIFGYLSWAELAWVNERIGTLVNLGATFFCVVGALKAFRGRRTKRG